jgi:hypothetical protein
MGLLQVVPNNLRKDRPVIMPSWVEDEKIGES